MPKEVSTISFEHVIAEINKAAIGTQLVISVVSDYQQQGEVAVPIVSVFKLEVMQATKPNLIDFLRKIHAYTPILRIQFSKVLSITPPQAVQEFIKLLEKQSCGPECKDCSCSEARDHNTCDSCLEEKSNGQKQLPP